MNQPNIGKYVPDELDKQCTAVFDLLRKLGLNNKPVEAIKLLDQCIDYLRMDEAFDDYASSDVGA